MSTTAKTCSLQTDSDGTSDADKLSTVWIADPLQGVSRRRSVAAASLRRGFDNPVNTLSSRTQSIGFQVWAS